MMYGSETWLVKAEDVSRIKQNDMRMIRWMCNVSVKDRLSSKELRKRLHLDSIGRIGGFIGLVMWREWTRMHGQVDAEQSK